MYEPDWTEVGDVRYRRKSYEVIHNALRILRTDLRHWNRLALAHGASRAPYQEEADDLSSMIDWGKNQLANPDALSITVDGISVASLCYQRAALEYAALKAEKEVAEKSKGMPPAVVASMLGPARAYAEEAQKIKQASAPILDELRQQLLGDPSLPEQNVPARTTDGWDVFISHASEDKESIARPLAVALSAEGLKVWFDEMTLTVGDGLRRSIDKGLARSKFGIVVLSHNFFAKPWPQLELDGLASRELNGVKVILPIWHGIDRETVAQYSPMLADRLAAVSSRGMPTMVADLLKAILR